MQLLLVILTALFAVTFASPSPHGPSSLRGRRYRHKLPGTTTNTAEFQASDALSQIAVPDGHLPVPPAEVVSFLQHNGEHFLDASRSGPAGRAVRLSHNMRAAAMHARRGLVGLNGKN